MNTSIKTFKPINTKLFIRTGVILLLASVLAACNGTSQTSPQAAAAPEVGIIQIQPQSVVISVELAGRTEPYSIAEVRPQVSGIIQQRLFKEGSDVVTGQALYQIDPASYQASYNSAVATLARDEANLTAARLKAERYKQLRKTGMTSQESYDDAVAAFKQAQATVDMSKATVESAAINLGYTRITAPIDGRISRSSFTQGALLTANQASPLTTIQQLDPIYVDITQSSAELLRLRRALSNGDLQRLDELSAGVSLILEDGSRYAHEGQLQFTEASVDERTGSVTLRAVFPNPDQQLLPGMYVRAVVQEGVRQNAILVPQQGVSRDARGQATALVLNADNKVEQRNLRVDRSLGNQWLVSEGLAANDRIIIDGLQKVRPGASARAVIIEPTTPLSLSAVN